VTITQARLGSSRLPGKVLMEIRGMTLLELHAKRAVASEVSDELVIATTTLGREDAVARHAEQLQYSVYRGSENDLLDRYYEAAKAYQADIVVRITSDCPLIDAALIDQHIRLLEKSGADFVSNTKQRTYPDGTDVEVFTMDCLERTWEEAIDEWDREHVTFYMIRNSDLNNSKEFKAVQLLCEDEQDYSHYRLTVDHLEDLELIKAIVSETGTDKTWMEYVKFLQQNPAIEKINMMHRTNEEDHRYLGKKD
ncbi:MAG: glycosyltransferase family protein, partial [Bacteroidetes bacterium]|nr:glycosyltransferase family protein [Bacteroidota bacterium]